jgi:hypothetical protein
MEVVCEVAVADTIAAHLRETCFANYSMVVYLSAVEVLRDDKF